MSNEVRFVSPMLASEGSMPPDDGRWAFEIKWDGQRLLVGNDRGRLRLWSRSGREVADSFPELGTLVQLLPEGTLLDGELVAFDRNGLSRFSLLQRRMQGLGTIQQQRAVPVTLIAFDILVLAGQSVVERPYRDRRRLLEGLGIQGPHWRTPAFQIGHGEQLFSATKERGLEGLIAKRLDGAYVPGRRSEAWTKLKHRQHEVLVIGGWRPNSEGNVASLLVGEEATTPGSLHYLGSVANGINADWSMQFAGQLRDIGIDASCFEGRQPRRPFIAVRPILAADIEYQERTTAGWLRSAVFSGSLPKNWPQSN